MLCSPSRLTLTIAAANSPNRLGATYYAKAEINLPGAGARIAAAEDTTREAAEGKVLAKVRRLLEKKS
ncbi:MAG: hypothetical protein ACE5H2_03580 [Terriglobia bacterium]